MRFLSTLIKSYYRTPSLALGVRSFSVAPPYFSQFLNFYKEAELGEEEESQIIGTEPETQTPEKPFDPVDDDDRMGTDHE